MAEATHILFVGIGSPHGDDQIGWRVADELAAAISNERNEPLHDWLVRKAKSPADLLNWLDGDSRALIQQLIVCDACRTDSPPGGIAAGTIHCWTWPDEELPAVRFTGSHDMGLAAALHLARTLERLPSHMSIWGIEICGAERGADVSASLAQTAQLAAKRIKASAEMTIREINSI